MDPKKLEKAITSKTKAILPVHLYGQMCAMDEIKEIAEKNNLKIIEDSAQAHGASYRGKQSGHFGDVATFSFYPAKNLGCYGDGGCAITNNEKIAEKIELLRDHGRISKYESKVEGYGYRLDALQAAILQVKLRHLSKWNDLRRQHAKHYTELLKNVITPYTSSYAKHVYHLYVVQTKNRDKLQEFLKKNDISTGIHYPVPLNKQAVYQNLNMGSFPTTEKYVHNILSLPMYPELDEEQIKFVVEKINSFTKSFQ
jgi:dTDP-4-amino-4,6-dideoxygalactose transaminase